MNKEITKRLFELQSNIEAISKQETNPFFNSKYFDINALIKHLRPYLKQNNLLLLQPIKDGKVFSIITDVESGESVESGIEIKDYSDPQKMGSAITYLRRYTLSSLLALESTDDDDGNSVAGNKYENKTSAPRTYSGQSKIENWLSQADFEKALNIKDVNELREFVTKWTSNGNGMKKQYKDNFFKLGKSLKND